MTKSDYPKTEELEQKSQTSKPQTLWFSCPKSSARSFQDPNLNPNLFEVENHSPSEIKSSIDFDNAKLYVAPNYEYKKINIIFSEYSINFYTDYENKDNSSFIEFYNLNGTVLIEMNNCQYKMTIVLDIKDINSIRLPENSTVSRYENLNILKYICDSYTVIITTNASDHHDDLLGADSSE